MIKLNTSTPRWVIFLLDILISCFSIFAAYMLRFNFKFPESEWSYFLQALPVFVVVRALSFYLGKTYAGIIRYTSAEDAKRILLVLLLGSIAFVGANFVRQTIDGKYVLPITIILIDFLVSVFLLLTSRISVKLSYLEAKNLGKKKNNVVIFGAGELGQIIKKALDNDTQTNKNLVAYIDEDKKKAYKKMEGVTIYPIEKLSNIIEKQEIHQIIIGVLNPKNSSRREVIDLGLKHNIKTLSVPPLEHWMNEELNPRQLRQVKIEDLLGRDQIVLDEEKIVDQIEGKIILVTGAAGSIGSELVRQIKKYSPKKILLLDIAESALYDLENELKAVGFHNYESIITDVRNLKSVDKIFQEYEIDVVFHAAAYKHVPLMEKHVNEAVKTNFIGTKNVADLAIKYKTKTIVFVSTDKAVNPTSVMGATKRLAEIYIQTLAAEYTKIITTRFGNVLGSNGSVIPLFKKQIEAGGPVTVTHPEITRYFMTIPEACQLVLEAAVMGGDNEVFVFDMGDSIKIIDLAKKMIKLSGLELDKDIEIKITGLRPGEKLFEELLIEQEDILPTHHKQIMIGKTISQTESRRLKMIKLVETVEGEPDELVKRMKEIIPEYKSENSVYEQLDKA